MPDDFFGYPVRKKLYPGEDQFFRSNPSTAGMASEDGSIILNPYSRGVNLDAVGRNEAARLWMRESGFSPEFDLTDTQAKSMLGTAYANDPKAARETILARIVSGDPSAKDATAMQKLLANHVMGRLRSRKVKK